MDVDYTRLGALFILVIGLILLISQPAATDCGLRRIVHRIEYLDCRPTKLLSYACQGSCRSYTEVSLRDEGGVDRHCSCCSASAAIMRQVAVLCYDRQGPRPFRRVNMHIMVPRGCMCRPCTTRSDVQPMELEGLDGKRTLWDLL